MQTDAVLFVVSCRFHSLRLWFHCICQEEKAKAYKKEKQKERKRRAEDDVDFEEDDEMAAVMGFSGFGSSKKSHWCSLQLTPGLEAGFSSAAGASAQKKTLNHRTESCCSQALTSVAHLFIASNKIESSSFSCR